MTEVVAAAALAVVETGVPRSLWLISGTLLAVLWISTGAFYAPLHGRLASRFDARVHARLVRSNWFRTIVWTVSGVLAAAMVAVTAM